MTATQKTVGMLFEDRHDDDRQQRPEKSPDRIERLAEAEARPAKMRRRDVGDQRVARGAADALADAVDEARRHQPADARRQREDRLGEGGEPVAERGEKFALAQPIRERAGEDLGDRGGRLGDALDDADGQRRGAERGDEIDRQERMDRLRRGVHEQGDEAEHPDPRRDRAKPNVIGARVISLPSSLHGGQRTIRRPAGP